MFIQQTNLVPKTETKTNRFSNNPVKVLGFVHAVIRSARISGRLFVRLKIVFWHFFDQQLKI